MKRRIIILITAAIVGSLFLPPLEAQAFPEILYSSNPYREYPVWVSATAAIEPSGKIHQELFFPAAKRTIEGYFTSEPRNGCFRVEEHYEALVNPADRSSLDKAVEHSAFILVGRITATAFGFNQYLPGQLLQVEPSEVLQGEALLDRYYVFYPAGTFVAGPYAICKTDRRYPRIPEIGDEVLLMIPEMHSLTDPYLELEEAFSIVVIRDSNIPDVPAVFKHSDADASEIKGSLSTVPKNKEDLIESVKRTLAKRGSR